MNKMVRKTLETSVELEFNLYGAGECSINTGIGFFDHMLSAFCLHSKTDLNISVKGDLHVDGHHTVEDVGIVLGKAFALALGDKNGIARYGSFFVPMDESLAFASMDVSGRSFLVWQCEFSNQLIGGFDTCLAEEFFRAFVMNSGITLHVRLEYGKNDHHKCEAIFKAVAHALSIACAKNGKNAALSTKGVI